MLRSLFRAVVRLTAFAGLAYLVYRLISSQEHKPEPFGAPSHPEVPGSSKPPVKAPARRPGAGTKPGGPDRPAARPEQPKPDGHGPSATAPPARSIGVGEVPAHVQRWVEPEDDGSCPISHPIKVKLESGIFHVPGGRHYDRTTADRCYRDAESAEADDFRQSKQ